MNRIIYTPKLYHIEDLQRIQKILENNGYTADLHTCDLLWREYSDHWAAGFLNLPDEDDKVLDNILYIIRNENTFQIVEE